MTQTTANLHPYRNYTIIVQAFTKCWGKENKTLIQTEIDSKYGFTNITLAFRNEIYIQ